MARQPRSQQLRIVLTTGNEGDPDQVYTLPSIPVEVNDENLVEAANAFRLLNYGTTVKSITLTSQQFVELP